ncbi:TetR/AcrR family transcriptional regulator [Symbioplanes lichenis]|uniref:TetR/AcrR family transcriptional regulator n=1 Tax=Symbioplanes lichenis TaxID=1629072 RepID=UPI002738915C|nr:TetR/AcrR family transcriptional regulator [Actinoplanes lichenis]
MSRRGYHHGDLRAALIATSFEELAEQGLPRFSVAAVARRLGVSTAAPYRHFPDRDRLLAAVSSVAAHDLRAEIATAAAAAGHDPRHRFAAAAATYVRFVARTGAGFDVIFAAELYAVTDPERTERTRALMTDLLTVTAEACAGPPEETVRLVEAMIATAHGYTTLFTTGFWRRAGTPLDEIADRAAAAARSLLA